MKHFLLFSVMLLAALNAAAQEMQVESMRMDMMDMTAAAYQRKDRNDVPCAIVKVRMPEGAAFEGSIIGNTEYRTGEYWVYVTAGTKFLRVKHPSAHPLHITFSDYGIMPLQSKTVYLLDISTATPMQTVEIRFSPADATVFIDGNIVSSTNGVATTLLPADRDYKYAVVGSDFNAEQGLFHLSSQEPVHLDVKLSQVVRASRVFSLSRTLQDCLRRPLQKYSTLDDILGAAERQFNNRNYVYALEYYKQIPDNSIAQGRIGFMYAYGLGVRQNSSEAVGWYTKSAEQGYDRAQYQLGIMYMQGRGVKQDYAEAARWYRCAAEQGYAPAQFNLGEAYYHGLGINENRQEALMWLKKAADQGLEEAFEFMRSEEF